MEQIRISVVTLLRGYLQICHSTIHIALNNNVARVILFFSELFQKKNFVFLLLVLVYAKTNSLLNKTKRYARSV